MRGKRAKHLRKLSNFSYQEWNSKSPDEKYNIKEHDKKIWSVEYIDGKPTSVSQDVKRYQILCRQPKSAYRILKRFYKEIT